MKRRTTAMMLRTFRCVGLTGGAGDEAGFLEGFAGGDVIDVAAAGGDFAKLVGGAFEFLDYECAQAAAAVGLGDGHVDVAVGWVVVMEEAAGGEDLAVGFEDELGAFVEMLRGDLRVV
jgi:hypothetical protein